MKYRHCDGKLELKVTNDRTCLKFLTDQASDLKKVEKLNNLFVMCMCGKDPQAEDLGARFRPAGSGRRRMMLM